jgi:hypothetical protein
MSSRTFAQTKVRTIMKRPNNVTSTVIAVALCSHGIAPGASMYANDDRYRRASAGADVPTSSTNCKDEVLVANSTLLPIATAVTTAIKICNRNGSAGASGIPASAVESAATKTIQPKAENNGWRVCMVNLVIAGPCHSH